jgi:hypothetical protein
MTSTIVVDPTRYEKMAFTKTVCFEAGDITIKFIAVSDNPGFAYVVLALREGKQIAKGWMREGAHPTHKNAEFYYNTLINGVYKH